MAIGVTFGGLPASHVHSQWSGRACAEAFAALHTWRTYVRPEYTVLQKWALSIKGSTDSTYAQTWGSAETNNWLDAIESYSRFDAAMTIQKSFKNYMWRKRILYNPHTAIGKWFLALQAAVFTRLADEYVHIR